ncbi:Endonuclease/exonuclease/phosphatase [Cinara cedri]|uniref:Endonuclease/exonuclease/phosphatase n=1 Tax=Cinara cedri TaxID=506608 RepID=A0A5E4MYM7_9HEMI|nr:Endonuclease/exonuclease/phosphatase [Cinara cedri]
MFKDADVLAIQETHVPSDKTSRLRVPGFNMVDYKGHAKHGLATYVNQNTKEQRWGTTTSPDLCFVTRDNDNQPLRVSRQILPKFPKSQHKPVVIDIGVNFPRINNPEMPRWNLRKARWVDFTKYMKENINRIPPTPKTYSRFVKLIKKAAVLAILRGHRQNYIPCSNKECDSLLHEYDQSGSELTANRLMSLLDEERRNRWLAAMEEMDYTHSSRKSWSLLRKLGAVHPSKKAGCVAAIDISFLLHQTAKN